MRSPGQWRKDGKRRKAFDADMQVATCLAGAQAKAFQRQYGLGAVYDCAFDYFPFPLLDLADDLGLCCYVDSKKEMRGVVREARRMGGLSFHPFSTTLGLFNGCDLLIDVVEGIKPDRMLGHRCGWQTTIDTAGHEMCHFADWSCNFISESSPSFKECFDADRALFTASSYKEIAEFFATAGWVSIRYPHIAALHMPKTFRWFEGFWFDYEIDDASLAALARGDVPMEDVCAYRSHALKCGLQRRMLRTLPEI